MILLILKYGAIIMKLKIILLVTSLTTIACQAANQYEFPDGFVEEFVLDQQKFNADQYGFPAEFDLDQVVSQCGLPAGFVLNKQRFNLEYKFASFKDLPGAIQLSSMLPPRKNESDDDWLRRVYSELAYLLKSSTGGQIKGWRIGDQIEGWHIILLYKLANNIENNIIQTELTKEQQERRFIILQELQRARIKQKQRRQAIEERQALIEAGRRLLPEGFYLDSGNFEEMYQFFVLQDKPGAIRLSSMCPQEESESLLGWLTRVNSKRARLSNLVFRAYP